MTFILYFSSKYQREQGKNSKFSAIWSVRHEPIVCTGWQVNVVIIGILRAFVLGADEKPETNF